MAVTLAGGLRVTIGERTWDMEEGSESGELTLTGPGAAIVIPLDGGPRRLLWAVTRGSARAEQTVALEIVMDGWRFEATLEPLGRARLRDLARRGAASVAAHAPLVVRAPIPGRIVTVRVAEGDAVEAGSPLMTLEAMKMENVVRAPRAGTIARVAVGTGQTVELGDPLLELA